MEPQTQKSQTPPPASGGGLAPNVASLLCYLCDWVTGLIFLLIEKNNKEVKFHAWQAIFFSAAMIAIYIVFLILGFILGKIGLGFIVSILWIVIIIGYWVVKILCMVKAYQGTRFKLPYIGDLAEQQANK